MNDTSMNQNINYFQLAPEEMEEIMELSGVSMPHRSNEDWIHLLRERLARQKRQFLALLDHAAENPELLAECDSFQREIRVTRQRLSDCRSLRSRFN